MFDKSLEEAGSVLKPLIEAFAKAHGARMAAEKDRRMKETLDKIKAIDYPTTLTTDSTGTYVTKDSGERRSFDTGAVRDKADGKGRYDLLPGVALVALGKRFKNVSYQDTSRDEQVDSMLTGCAMVASGNRDGFSVAVANAMLIMEVDETGDNRRFSEPVPYALNRIPPVAIRRLAQLYERGAVKYSARNWEKGMPLSVYLDSMTRHAFQASEGKTDEDHLAAVCFNGLAAIHFLELGRDELDDLPGKARMFARDAVIYVPEPIEDNTEYTITEWESPLNKTFRLWDIYDEDGKWYSGWHGAYETLDKAVERVVALIDPIPFEDYSIVERYCGTFHVYRWSDGAIEKLFGGRAAPRSELDEAVSRLVEYATGQMEFRCE